MKTTLKLAALACVAAPLMAFAQDAAPLVEVTEEELASFRDAITLAGCTINDEGTASQVETLTGYDEDTLSAIVAQLRVYDEIVDASDEGGITLISGACAS